MAAQQDTHPPVFAILNHPWITMKCDYQDPHEAMLESLWQGPAAGGTGAAPTALQSSGRGPVLSRLSPLLGPRGARSLWQVGAAHPFQARLPLRVLSFHLLAWM